MAQDGDTVTVVTEVWDGMVPFLPKLLMAIGRPSDKGTDVPRDVWESMMAIYKRLGDARIRCVMEGNLAEYNKLLEAIRRIELPD